MIITSTLGTDSITSNIWYTMLSYIAFYFIYTAEAIIATITTSSIADTETI